MLLGCWIVSRSLNLQEIVLVVENPKLFDTGWIQMVCLRETDSFHRVWSSLCGYDYLQHSLIIILYLKNYNTSVFCLLLMLFLLDSQSCPKFVNFIDFFFKSSCLFHWFLFSIKLIFPPSLSHKVIYTAQTGLELMISLASPWETLQVCTTMPIFYFLFYLALSS